MLNIYHKVDKIFEQFDVTREPVRSELMATVTSRVKTVFDDVTLKKYEDVTDQQLEQEIKKHRPQELAAKVKKIIENSRKVKSTDLGMMKTAGVDRNTAMASKKIEKETKVSDPAIIKRIQTELAQSMGNLLATRMSGDELAKRLVADIQRIGAKYGMTKTKANAVMMILLKDNIEDPFVIAARIVAGEKIPAATGAPAPVRESKGD